MRKTLHALVCLALLWTSLPLEGPGAASAAPISSRDTSITEALNPGSSSLTPSSLRTAIELSGATPGIAKPGTSAMVGTSSTVPSPTITGRAAPTATVGLSQTAIISPEAGGLLRAERGQISVIFPPGAVDHEVEVTYTPIRPGKTAAGRAIVKAFELDAVDTGHGNAKVSRFARDLQIRVEHAAAETQGLDLRSLRLYFMDGGAGKWAMLPYDLDAASGVITATVDHFTQFGTQADPNISGPGIINSFQTDLHSGTAIMDYPLELPPGPGGFSPELSLRYNSGGADNMRSKRSLASWVGTGWSLSLGRISYDEGLDKYYLEMNGVGDELLPETGSNNWHTKEERFYHIVKQGDTWQAWDRSGTYYEFGGTGDGKQYYKSWNGNGWDTHDYRWDLKAIVDTSGNRVDVFNWQDVFWDCSSSPCVDYIRAAYPQSLTYAGGRVRVDFGLESNYQDASLGAIRIDDARNGAIPAPKVMETRLLRTITVSVDGQVARSYQLDYQFDSAYWSVDNGGTWYSGKMRLTAITPKGADGSALPTLSLTNADLESWYNDPYYPSIAEFYWPRLTAAANGYGGQVQFTYAQIPQPWQVNLQWTREVVASKQVSDGMGNASTYTYNYYDGPKYKVEGDNYYDEEYRGFGEAHATDPDGNYAKSWFYTTGTVNGKDGEILTGRDYRTEWYADSNVFLKKAETDWNFNDPLGRANFVHADQITQTVGAKQTRTSYVYDSYGNTIKEFDYGDLSDASDDRSTHRSFTANTTNWIVDKPAWGKAYEGITEDVGGSALKAQTTYFYDGAVSSSTPPTKGLLTKTTKGLGAVTATTSFSYDQWGNPTVITDARGYASNAAYDDIYHTYPVRQTNALGQQTATAYDYRFAKPTVVTDVNGVATLYQYDTFGRITANVKAGDSVVSPTLAYEYNYFGTAGQQQVMVKEKDNVSQYPRPGYHVQRRFFDGLGRIIQTNDQMADGRYSVVTTEYDSRGQIRRTSVPYVKLFSEATLRWYTPTLDAAIIQWTTTDYDGLGRATTMTHPDNTFSQKSYSDWTSTAIDENGHRKDYVNDAYGRLSQVKEYQGGNIFTTQYTYDILDDLTRVQDSQGHLTTMSYDALGRKVGMTDPDMGNWSYGYDATGNLTSQTDALSQTITFDYDPLNRLSQKNLPGNSHVVYHYDDNTPGAYRIGRLWKVDNPLSAGGGWTATFDARGRTVSRTETISDTAYTTSYGYDPLDRVASMTYPGGESLSQSYDDQTLVKKVSSSITEGLEYLSNLTYNALGQPLIATLGNGAKTEYTYYDGTSASPATSRLYQINSYLSGGGTLQKTAYDYDKVGNVTGMIDHLNDGDGEERQTFQYDEMDRLVAAAGRSQGTPAYDQSFAYNSLGNLTAKGGKNYTYHPTKAHALTGEQTNTEESFYDDFSAGSGNWSPISGTWQVSNWTYSGHANSVSEAFASLSNWTPLAGTWALENGELSQSDASAASHRAQWNVPTSDAKTDFTFSTDLKQVGGNNGAMGLLFRLQDADNYYAAYLQSAAVRLYKKVNGTTVWSATPYTFAFQADTYYNLKVTTWGNQIKVYINGTLAIYKEDSGWRGGSLQLFSYGGHNHYDNVKFGALAYSLANSLPGSDLTYELKAKGDPASGYAPIFVFRWQDGDNHYLAYPTGTEVRLYRMQGGVLTLLQSGGPAGLLDGNWHSYRVMAEGSVIQVYADGVLAVNVTDNQVSGQKIGVGVSYDVPLYLDDVSAVRSTGATTYGYDANGNMTSGAGRTIAWDAENRPITITLNGVTTNFAYNGDGKRIEKTETSGGTVTTTLYVGNFFEQVFINNVLTETISYYYAGDKRIAMRRIASGGGDGTLYYIFSDHLGGTSVTLNATTGATSTVSYLPFGARRSSTGSLQTDRLFTGQRLDGTGLYDYGARQYDPSIGRFISPDVIVSQPFVPQDLNRYSYTSNNPVRYIDPSGHRRTDSMFSGIVASCDGLCGVGGGSWGSGPPLSGGAVIRALAAAGAGILSWAASKIGIEWNASHKNQEVTNSQGQRSDEGGQTASPPPPLDPFKQKGPLEGKTNYLVRDPTQKGRNITDIDRIEGKVLWEEKLGATNPASQSKGINTNAKWISENITDKFSRYVEARNAIDPFYQDAAIGFRLSQAADAVFKSQVEAEIANLQAANPSVTILLEWVVIP